MNPNVVFDLTRLFVGPINPTPRGIDRVDLSYAAHFLERWPGDCVATLSTPFGVRALDRRRALRLIGTVTSIWGETTSPDDDMAYRFVKASLVGAERSSSWRWHKSAEDIKRTIRGLSCAFANSGGIFGVGAASKVPLGSVYLNTGQLGLASGSTGNWLRKRGDIKPVYMLHDTIPIDYPEYIPALAKGLYANMVASAARYGQGLIVTTETVRESVQRVIASYGRKDMPIVAARLPVDPIFLVQEEIDPALQGCRYFVVCGSIEPRKNVLLLLNVWQKLVQEAGQAAPKLVVVGTPWQPGSGVTNLLHDSDSLRKHVITVKGLTTPALRRLLSGATALLMPSLVEGFGLPIVEALARGTPVIASDLPAHREVGGSYVTYVDPRDELGWFNAIRAHTNDRATYQEKLENYRNWTWTDYAKCVVPFIEEVWRNGK